MKKESNKRNISADILARLGRPTKWCVCVTFSDVQSTPRALDAGAGPTLDSMNPNGAVGAEDEDVDALHEGDPHPLPYAFEKELIEKCNRHIRLCKTFVPVSKVYPLAGKFYAQHEKQQPLHPQRFLRYTEVAQHERRTKLGLPLLESQVYGWLPLETSNTAGTAAIHLNFVHAPKLRCRMTIHGEHLIAEQVTERPPFNGLRFLLH